MSENREKPRWEGKHYSFFQNTECEYFPCHRIADPARFSCGGNFRYTEKGIKDCTGCLIPHLPENYGRITGKYQEIAAAMQQAEHTQNTRPTQSKEDEQQTDPPQNTTQNREGCRPLTSGKKAASQDLHARKTSGLIVMLACTERGFETMRHAAAALQEHLPETEILQTGRCLMRRPNGFTRRMP